MDNNTKLEQIKAKLLEQAYIIRGLTLVHEQEKAYGNLKACQTALIFLECAARKEMELKKQKRDAA